MDALSGAIVRLLRRLEETEHRLARIEKVLGLAQSDPAPETPPSAASDTPAKPAEPETAPLPTMPEPPADRQFETRLGLMWVNRIGVLTLVLGVAFFFKYAIDNQWIGETARVALGILAGIAALGLADRSRRKGHTVYAQGVCGAGLAILYVSFYAAFGFYHLLPPAFIFPPMVLTTVLAGFLAIRYESVAIAVMGLAGGYATPILLSTGEDRPWFFFGYVLLLNTGALVVARLKKWRQLEILAFAATLFLYFSWLDDRFQTGKRPVATFYALVYYGLFTLVDLPIVFVALHIATQAALLTIWTSKFEYLLLSLAVSVAGLAVADRRTQATPATAAFGSFWVFYFAWHQSLRQPDSAGLILIALTAAFLLFLCWAPWRLLKRGLSLQEQDLVLLALGGPVYFAASYALLDPNYHPWLGSLAVALSAAYSLLGAYLWAGQEEATRDRRPVLLAVGIAIAFLILTAPVQFSGYRITMIWALEAAALCWVAARVGSRHLRHAGMLVLVLVLCRVFLLDSWIYGSADAYMAIWNARFLTLLIAALCCWAAAYWTGRNSNALAAYAAGHGVMLWSLGLEVLGWAARAASVENLASVSGASISILMAAYAVLLVGIGVFSRSGINRILGLALVGLVVVKLYLYDVWLLKRIYRVAAFAVLGVLLLLTSYLYSRYKASIEEWWKKEKADPGV